MLPFFAQVPNLSREREQVYATEWGVSIPQFELRTAGMRAKTIANQTRWRTLDGDWMFGPGCVVFVDGAGVPRLTETGHRIIGPVYDFAHRSYQPAMVFRDGEVRPIVHLFENRLPWPSEVVVSAGRRRGVAPQPRRSFVGKLWHWLTRD